MTSAATTTDSPRAACTALGILAILIWSTSFAFGRSIMEQLGTFGGAACIYTLGGVLGCALMILQRRLGDFLRMPPAYLLVCGGLFITYILAVQMGIGFARDRQQAVEVILLNYLWPGLTMALSVPLQRRPARWWLIPGVLLAVAGTALGVASGRDLSGWHLLENLRAQPGPYLLGLIAAVSWALYSNLSRRLAGNGKGSGVPVFLLASGLAMGVLYLFSDEQMHWTQWTHRVRLELLYAALFPGLLAYMFWETRHAPRPHGPGRRCLLPDAAPGDRDHLPLPGRAAGRRPADRLRPGHRRRRACPARRSAKSPRADTAPARSPGSVHPVRS